MDEKLQEMADLLDRRNAIDAAIAKVTGRPMTSGHLGEWIASVIFDIELEQSAVAAAIDGRFRSGALQGRSVNVKWYLKREGLLDMTMSDVLDHYLVLTGPKAAAASSKGSVRPWTITNVYLFDAQDIKNDLLGRGLKIGVASSVRDAIWDAAEVYPRQDPRLPLTEGQRAQLALFSW
jgi:hypothetical protein